VDAPNNTVSNSRRKRLDRTARRNRRIYFNTPLLERDRSSRQKIIKDKIQLNNTINQLNIMAVYRLSHPVTAECTLLCSNGILIQTDHILGHT
jgi:hypothetical protein